MTGPHMRAHLGESCWRWTWHTLNGTHLRLGREDVREAFAAYIRKRNALEHEMAEARALLAAMSAK